MMNAFAKGRKSQTLSLVTQVGENDSQTDSYQGTASAVP
jgi:hypothetical protein